MLSMAPHLSTLIPLKPNRLIPLMLNTHVLPKLSTLIPPKLKLNNVIQLLVQFIVQ